MNILSDSLKEKYLDFKNSELYKDYKFDKEELNKIKIDVTFTDKNSKTHCTYSAVEWAKKQLFANPEIKPLVHVIKRHLQINKLNSSFNGKIILLQFRWIKFVFAITNARCLYQILQDDHNEVNDRYWECSARVLRIFREIFRLFLWSDRRESGEVRI